jgi:hypothetical protein
VRTETKGGRQTQGKDKKAGGRDLRERKEKETKDSERQEREATSGMFVACIVKGQRIDSTATQDRDRDREKERKQTDKI